MFNVQVRGRAADRRRVPWNAVLEPLARVAWQNLVVSSTRNMGQYIAIVQEDNLIDIDRPRGRTSVFFVEVGAQRDFLGEERELVLEQAEALGRRRNQHCREQEKPDAL